MRIRNTVLTTGALAAALLVAGCSAGATSEPAPAPATSEPAPSASNQANEVDIAFVQGMIPHHEQAVEMSDILLAKDGVDERVVALAQQIKDAQGPEIELMQSWLQEWGAEEGESEDDAHGGHDEGGMMSHEEMEALEAADGVEAAKLFLSGMVVHHEGAVEMAQPVIDEGQHPEVVALAEQVIADQSAEIETMNELLASL